jgi:photosystem II stability/assembly factor-like uncharacterized protein
MLTIYLVTDDGPVIITRSGDRWRVKQPLKERITSTPETNPCIAADPHRSERAFCGMAQMGVWRSDDAGENWHPVFEGIPNDLITAVAVSRSELVDGHGVVYVGTQPSAIFRSEDGGDTWRTCEGLTDLPSSSEWAFPPKPDTHHARWIEPDPHDTGRLYVAIEAGALVYSPDGGSTWQDRVPDGPWDTHQLATHLDVPGRLWSAAGDGFFESDDAGKTWHKNEQGLRHRYCWSVAVDPGDPRIVLLSSASGARQAHNRNRAEAHLYRRTADDDPWREISDGLPSPRGIRAFALAADPAESGVFYAGIEGALFRSTDAGATWHRLPVDWLDYGGGARVYGLEVVEVG